jgi:E3 ubiquitin-protein ligase HUWE1
MSPLSLYQWVTLSVERTAQNTLHTVLFDSFYRKRGLDAIVAIGHSFIRTVVEHSQTKAEDRTEIANQALGQAYGGIKVALHLLHALTSSKPIFESSQTILLLTRDKKDTDPDYFEPHNFLVKIRLVVLPIIREIWEASWLVSAPQSLIKSVVQVVLEVLNGEGEESPPDISPHTVPGAGSLSMGGPSLFRVTVPDENRVRQLTDMGFSRSGAERALIRTHNNVNAATELLLSNPFRFQNDPEPAAPPPQEPEGTGEATGETAGETTGETAGETVGETAEETPPTATEAPPADLTPMQDDVATPSLDDSQAVDTDTRPPGKSADEWRSELNSMREPMKSEVGRLALRLVDEHPDLIFDIHNAFVSRDDGYQRSSVRLLIDDIPSFAASPQDGREQQLAVRCRLLALVLNEAPASFAAIVMGDEQAFMEVVLTLLLSIDLDTEANQPIIPKWLAALMLVAEALLSLSEDPRSITVPKEGEPIVAQPEILTGPPYVEARTVLFGFSLRLLSLPSLPRDELLASLRLLVFMTRDHELAMQFVKGDGVSLLFKSLKSSSGGVAGSQSYISIILRHIVEDPAVLRLIMREEIQRFLSHPRTRTVDTTGYVRACNAMALRDPKAFIEVTKSLAQLERPFAYNGQILPKDQDNQEGGSPTGESGKDAKTHTGSQPEVTTHTLSSPPEYFEAIVHFLVGELIESVRTNPRSSEGAPNPEPTSPDTSAEGNPRQPAQPERNPPTDAQDSKPDHYYSGFLMQSLTELMFSYDACKTAFLSYSPSRRSGIPSKDASKGRLAALNFVLSDLVSFRTIDPVSSNDARNNVPLCNWAMSLVVALCVDTSSSQPIKDVSPELVAVRKTVLEAVSRAIKDPSQSESLDARYGRLLALADLCYRLLTVRFNPGLRKPHEETPTHIAKIMLEKNFVSTLTNALAEVDLNYPNVRVVVAAMLKPLELL